ncbi:MAG: hypothetical protein OXH50_15315 [Gemmatimonadetes bacterium]|nr:hypothetical protein [Gemmatimonadota bacterium]
MSTCFHDLKDPWSNLVVEEGPEHCRMTLWDNQGSQAGSLTVRAEDGHEAIRQFFRDDPVCQTWFDARGKVLRKYRDARTATLLSEYGGVVTGEELRKECYRRHDVEPEPTPDDLV